MKKQFVIYIRVSTQRQGKSGLGLEAQRKTCTNFITANDGECVAEYQDVESGTHRDRPGLAAAIADCKTTASALVIAKLDRLARDVEFCFRVINTGIEIHFCDMPQINTLLLGVFASVAQYERELTSERTKRALAAKIARGEKTGGASETWLKNYNNKTKEERKKESMIKGAMKNERYLASKDTQAFLKVLKSVFPQACTKSNPKDWDWECINTKGEAKERIYSLMRDYKELDDTSTLFRKFDFTQPKERVMSLMRSHLHNVRVSVFHDTSTPMERWARREQAQEQCSLSPISAT